MSYASEISRRSGITLAMQNRLKWLTDLRAQGPHQGHEHLAYTLLCSI